MSIVQAGYPVPLKYKDIDKSDFVSKNIKFPIKGYPNYVSEYVKRLIVHSKGAEKVFIHKSEMPIGVNKVYCGVVNTEFKWIMNIREYNYLTEEVENISE